MDTMTAVIFNRSHGNYNAGDMACFGPDETARLVNIKIDAASGLMLARVATEEERKAHAAKLSKTEQKDGEPPVSVVFIASSSPYTIGDQASFPRPIAEQLVRDGRAMYNPKGPEEQAQARRETAAARKAAAEAARAESAKDRKLRQMIREVVEEVVHGAPAGKSPVRGEARVPVKK